MGCIFVSLCLHQPKKNYLRRLKRSKTKRQNLGFKYLLATYKEKIGEIQEAMELYKEVIENGNKLYIVQEAKEKLENIENKRNEIL